MLRGRSPDGRRLLEDSGIRERPCPRRRRVGRAIMALPVAEGRKDMVIRASDGSWMDYRSSEEQSRIVF